MLGRGIRCNVDLVNGVEILCVDCPQCGVRCETNRMSITYVGYISPAGHDHDDNCRVFYFKCSNGHEFNIRVRNTCPVCNWKGDKVCSICE